MLSACRQRVGYRKCSATLGTKFSFVGLELSASSRAIWYVRVSLCQVAGLAYMAGIEWRERGLEGVR